MLLQGERRRVVSRRREADGLKADHSVKAVPLLIHTSTSPHRVFSLCDVVPQHCQECLVIARVARLPCRLPHFPPPLNL